MPTMTRPHRPRRYADLQPVQTADPADLVRLTTQINQLESARRAHIAARVLGNGPDPAWIAEHRAIETHLDRLFAQKRQLLVGLVHRIC